MDTEARIRDALLALRCQTGELGAFEDLIDTMGKPLLYYAIKLVGSRDAASDILQETWIRALRDVRRLKDPGSIRPWLYRIVHGLAVDDVRRRRAREEAEEILVKTPDEPEINSFSAEDAASIHRGLDELEPIHREVLTLFFLEGFSIAEIATVINRPEGTVKSRLHHAKRQMRVILAGGTYAK